MAMLLTLAFVSLNRHFQALVSKQKIENNCNILNENVQPSAVQINNVTFSGFQGSSASEQAIILSCSKVGCTNVVLDHVNITSAKPGMLLTAKCNNVNGRSSFTVPEVPCLSRQ